MKWSPLTKLELTLFAAAAGLSVLCGWLLFWPPAPAPALEEPSRRSVEVAEPDQAAAHFFGWIPPKEGGAEHYFGWRRDESAVRRVVQHLRYRSFSATPAYLAGDPPPAEVYLWKAHLKLFGILPPSKNQGAIGSCVSFGTNNAVARTLAVAVAFAGAPYDYKDIAEEVTYGGGRQQICHQGAGGDGTNGSCCAKFVQQYGVCPREKVAGYDLTTYSVPLCRQFGNKGAPKEILEAMKDNKVKDITLIRTWTEAKTCLANGWGVAICSGVGFESKRDANGIKQARGSWPHCMCLDGYCTIDGKEYGHIENSWGDEEGPTGPGSPSKAGFWAAATTVGRMLGAGDSWAFSDVQGWPPRKINWFVFNQPNGGSHARSICRALAGRGCGFGRELVLAGEP